MPCDEKQNNPIRREINKHQEKILKAIRFCSSPITQHIYGQNHNSQRYMRPYVHSSTIHNSQDMEITYMEITDEEIKKM